ncbi:MULTISPECIES: DUF6124 family protein [unclassified Pseudomonas]|uniref:DUF6124 family protein n=1 Tax=unclassified Pseudomonas TaxID=196821 RepID=UPI000CD13E44|nr:MULTISPECIES: DUF6124 family protein [unclassified Pseudomonas]POA26473.1 hypothetical protein C1887_28560 [Pseudomonas sp. GW456-R21]POA64923.1 hypothetical protein C1884_19230 [Pseudomonas sp. GW460-R15]
MKKFTLNIPEKATSPVSNLFTLRPDIDTETLLIHTSETLASLNVMTSDLAFQLEDSRRNVALAIQQLIVLGELLVNRALEHFDTPDAAHEPQPAAHH